MESRITFDSGDVLPATASCPRTMPIHAVSHDHPSKANRAGPRGLCFQLELLVSTGLAVRSRWPAEIWRVMGSWEGLEIAGTPRRERESRRSPDRAGAVGGAGGAGSRNSKPAKARARPDFSGARSLSSAVPRSRMRLASGGTNSNRAASPWMPLGQSHRPGASNPGCAWLRATWWTSDEPICRSVHRFS